jgi:hypothetical protein
VKTALCVIVLLVSQAVYAQQPGTSANNPIIAMSADPAQIALDVRASLAFLGYPPSDDAQWIGYCDHVSNGWSDGLWRLGWNRYWEVRASGAAAADASLGNLPAVHRSTPTAPVPAPVPPPAPAPTFDLSSLQASVSAISAQNERIFADLQNRITAVSGQVSALDAKVSAIQQPASGPSVFGQIGSFLKSPTGMVIESIVGTYMTCRASGKC